MAHQLFADCKGFATYANAERKLRTVMGEMLDEPGVSWFIVALPSGRFMPAVRLNERLQYLLGGIAQQGVAVVG